MENSIAVISGITGQDGSYLVELLLSKSQYKKIFGITRRKSTENMERLSKEVLGDSRLTLKSLDLTDSFSIFNLIKEIKETETFDRLEIYNLAAQSHVKVSFDTPEYTMNVDGLGPLRFLEAIRQNELIDKARFYQAGTSEMFGKVQEVPQTETTPFYPRSPYGVAKLYGHWITKNYRESYGIFACNGILFNHESERRGEDFVTRKITKGIGKILRGEQDCISLGNIDSKRDWGHAKDYVEGMWLMLQADKPDDYVLATGETHSVREFIEVAFRCANIDIVWEGEGINEVGTDKKTGRVLVKINPDFFRPAEVELLVGNYKKANQDLKWKPKIDFQSLTRNMIMVDL
jgi:GDPmannose 4,6-dehydratase